MTSLIKVICLATLASCVAILSPLRAQTVINEIRIDQPGSGDPDEFFELRGVPGELLDGLWYLVLGDTNSNDGTIRGGGVVEEAIPLAGHAIPGNGYFLATQETFSTTDSTLFRALRFENNDTVTHLLVQDFQGVLGEDLDPDDNDALDFMPWAGVLDAVGVMKADPAGNTDVDKWEYASFLFPNSFDKIVGPDGAFAPGHVYRDELGDDSWRIGRFDPTAADANDTPGRMNGVALVFADCDFTQDGFCNQADVNSLYAAGRSADPEHNLRVGVDINQIDEANPTAALALRKFDLNNDDHLNNQDLTAWLNLSAGHNGYNNAYRRGDTDGLGVLSPDRRDVDITDFNALASHFNPTGAVAGNVPWQFGNFDGDGDVDITDFNFLAANFAPNGYNQITPIQPTFPGDQISSVPEPTAFMLIAAGVLSLLGHWSLHHSKR